MNLFDRNSICLTCFEPFSLMEALFRCDNPSCAGRTEDLEFNAFMDGISQGPQGRILKAKNGGWGNLFNGVPSAKCDTCGHITQIRICPNCHSELPHDIGQGQEVIISVIGGRGAGKGFYIGALLPALENLLPRRFHYSFQPINETTRERFSNAYKTRLYHERHILDPTQSAKIDRKVRTPMTYRLTSTQSGKRRAVNLIFFDSAGEDMQQLRTMSAEARYICLSGGIIFVIDPLQVISIRRELERTGYTLPPYDGEVEPENIEARLRELFERRFGLKSTDKIQAPVAFMLSKVDALEPLLSPDSLLMRQGDHPGFFNVTEADVIQAEVKTLIQKYMGEGFIGNAQSGFECFHFFGVSATGRAIVDDNVNMITPVRVEEPFLWLLSENGLMEKRRK